MKTKIDVTKPYVSYFEEEKLKEMMTRSIFNDKLNNIIFAYINEPMNDYTELGKDVAEVIVECIRSFTYGDTTKEEAQQYVYEFLDGFSSIRKKI
jgi:hypothetical protein